MHSLFIVIFILKYGKKSAHRGFESWDSSRNLKCGDPRGNLWFARRVPPPGPAGPGMWVLTVGIRAKVTKIVFQRNRVQF